LTIDFGSEHLELLGKSLDQPQERRAQERLGKLWVPTLRDFLIEENLKIRTKTIRQHGFKLNRAQQEFSQQCTKQNIVLKARQVGITTYIAARFFVQTTTQRGTLSLQVAHNREAAEDLFQIVHRFWTNLPEGWRKGALRTSRCNSRQLVFPELDSQYCVASADENTGRGRTIQNLHCSEVSRWGRKGDEALASLRAAVVPGGNIVLESTPNGAGGLFYEEWQRAADTGYTRHFFPWWYDAAYVIEPGAEPPFTEEEEALQSNGISNEQIAWRRKQWASLRGLARQEYAEDDVSCFRVSGECVFELAAVGRALEGAGEALELRDNERLTIWLPTQAGREYVIGADPAGGGTEGDYSCAEVIDRELGTQCAELHGHWPPREFARKMVQLGKEYNTALLAVERNNHGSGVLAHLQTAGYPKVYKQQGQDGWWTSAVSRPRMIENLGDALIEEPGLFRSRLLLNECRTFVRFADGNTGAAAGTHDDCVMAMAIAWAVRKGEAGRTERPVG